MKVGLKRGGGPGGGTGDWGRGTGDGGLGGTTYQLAGRVKSLVWLTDGIPGFDRNIGMQHDQRIDA